MFDKIVALASYDLQRKHGKAKGLGVACDIVTACLDEKRALDKCSQGYAEACFDITARLLEELRRLT